MTTQITFQSSAATSRSHGVITAFADAQSAAALKREATTRGDALLRDATTLESRPRTDWVGGLPLTVRGQAAVVWLWEVAGHR